MVVQCVTSPRARARWGLTTGQMHLTNLYAAPFKIPPRSVSRQPYNAPGLEDLNAFLLRISKEEWKQIYVVGTIAMAFGGQVQKVAREIEQELGLESDVLRVDGQAWPGGPNLSHINTYLRKPGELEYFMCRVSMCVLFLPSSPGILLTAPPSPHFSVPQANISNERGSRIVVSTSIVSHLFLRATGWELIALVVAGPRS